jgi:oxygen-dependent protoporphyrinogen oxidase
MESISKRSPRIAVIGAGISGLSAAAHLAHKLPQASVEILEASDRAGGAIFTECRDDLIIEHAADNFATNSPHVESLHQCLSICPELLRPNQEHRFAQVVRRGKLYPIPVGFSMLQPTRLSAVLQSPILSPMGKARLLAEQFIASKSPVGDESLESFAIRRLGREVFDRLVEPIICGIFTAKPDHLSMQAALPQFLAMEREYGSLIGAARALRKANPENSSARDASGARYDIFAAPANGMSNWIGQLVGAMPANVKFRSNHRLLGLRKNPANSRWDLTISVGSEFEDKLSAEFDGCVIALNAPRAGDVLETELPSVAAELSQIEYASSAIAVFGIPAESVPESAKCFGIVVPRIENRDVLAISFSSLKYPGRCPQDTIIARVFIGGAMRPDLFDKNDSDLEQIAWQETTDLLPLRSLPEPRWSRIVRWPRSMPQYSVGHVERVKRINQALTDVPTLKLCGNGYQGVGIPQSIHSGELAATALSAHFTAGSD